jgi:hypothetical protein
MITIKGITKNVMTPRKLGAINSPELLFSLFNRLPILAWAFFCFDFFKALMPP